jgi:hypothetical protein
MSNPIVKVDLNARIEDRWVYKESGKPYVGSYHLHKDGTAMINAGVIGIVHDLNPSEVIIKRGIRDTNTRRKF